MAGWWDDQTLRWLDRCQERGPLSSKLGIFELICWSFWGPVWGSKRLFRILSGLESDAPLETVVVSTILVEIAANLNHFAALLGTLLFIFSCDL